MWHFELLLLVHLKIKQEVHKLNTSLKKKWIQRVLELPEFWIGYVQILHHLMLIFNHIL